MTFDEMIEILRECGDFPEDHIQFISHLTARVLKTEGVWP